MKNCASCANSRYIKENKHMCYLEGDVVDGNEICDDYDKLSLLQRTIFGLKLPVVEA